jgi:putative NADH-flavin reductase
LKLFLLGATGRTGTHLIDLALARGHRVTAFVRSPEKITRQDEGLKMVKGDPLKGAELAAALPGHDAVISALGPRPGEAFKPHTLMADGAAALVPAMDQAKVRRLLLVSAASLFETKGPFFAFLKFLFRHIIKDLEAAEKIIKESDLDWTLVRPPRLVESQDESYKSLENALPKGLSISWRAVAAFLLDEAEKGRHIRKVVGISR